MALQKAAAAWVNGKKYHEQENVSHVPVPHLIAFHSARNGLPFEILGLRSLHAEAWMLCDMKMWSWLLLQEENLGSDKILAWLLLH